MYVCVCVVVCMCLCLWGDVRVGAHIPPLYPPPQFETRYKETERARAIFERYVLCIPSVRAWIKYAKFEYAAGEVANARRCYERALQDLSEEETSVELYVKFAEFEEMVKEPERARAIYKYVFLFCFSSVMLCVFFTTVLLCGCCLYGFPNNAVLFGAGVVVSVDSVDSA